MTTPHIIAALAMAAALLGTSGSRAATIYTGDIIQGKRVVSQLDVNDLEPGKKHSLYFQGVQMGSGQHWYVPVVVVKGASAGKRVVLISDLHGDELSPLDAVQRTVAQLDPATMAGTVTAVYDVSRPAKEATTRMWPIAQWGGQLIDLNRVWPGNENGGNAPSRHAALAFNRLLKPNADYALDFHTAATGGGSLELLVDLRSTVAVGQVVAIQRDSFGEVVREYKPEVAGEVSTLQRDAMIEPGTRVVQIL